MKALSGDDVVDAAFYDLDETPGELGDRDRVHGNEGDDYHLR